MMLYRCISQPIQSSNPRVQFWRQLRMHSVQDRHHEACYFAANVHVLIHALGETYALLVPMVYVRKPRLYAVACVLHCGMHLSKGSHHSLLCGYKRSGETRATIPGAARTMPCTTGMACLTEFATLMTLAAVETAP